MKALLPLRFVWAPMLLLPFSLGIILALPTAPRVLLLVATLVAYGLLLSGLLIRGRPMIKLCLHAARCQTFSAEGFRLHFRPQLSHRITREGIPKACQSTFDALLPWFGAPKALAIYLFENEHEINRIMGQPLAHAIPQFNAALVPLGATFHRALRHELAHLFATRLGPLGPPLKSEGLAVWVEFGGQSPFLAQDALQLLAERGGLAGFAQAAPFLNPHTRDTSYLIAGSFTGFLIGRFGWGDYCRFYMAANLRNFLPAFERAFSLSLAQAESLWRQQLSGEEPGCP